MALTRGIRDDEYGKFKDKYEKFQLSLNGTTTTGGFSTLKEDIPKDILIQNFGATTCYLVIGTTSVGLAPSTTATMIDSKRSLEIGNCGFTHVSAICASGNSTSIVVTGISRGNIQ